MKKIISLILAFAMVFSLAMPAFAADDTRTIYFENTGNWSSVYAWDASAAAYLGNWPGTAMSKVEGETNIYSIEVSTAAINVIFNNGGGSQTDDLTIPTDGKNLYNYGTGTWSTYDSAGDTSDQTKGDVTASYTPTVTIDSVTVGGDSVTVDNENQTYTVTIPADAESVWYYVYITGVNLDTIPDTSADYLVSMVNMNMCFHGGRYYPDLGRTQLSGEVTADNVGTYDLRFTTDGGTNWFDTEWDIVVQKAEAESTAVSLNVMLKAIDSSTGTEITEIVAAILSASSVDNISMAEYGMISTGDHTMTWNTVPSGYQTPADISVTVTDTNGDGVGELTSNSSHATVDLVDGVYVITVTLEAESTEVSEAKWGASMDSLTGSGTLAEAIAAAQADSTVKYIQLQSDVTAESSFEITSGEFTIDLNGQTVTCSDSNTFGVLGSGAKVTFADSGTTGAVTSGSATQAAIMLQDGGEALITGGSYSGNYALSIDSSCSAAITGGTFTGTGSYAIDNTGTLTISGGTIGSGSWANIGVSGTVTITGGTFTGSGDLGNFAYWSGTLDLSGYSDVTGLQVSNYSGSDLAVSDTTIKLPANYTFVDDSNNPVTTLAYSVVYTIAAVSGGEDTAAKITGVKITVDDKEYTSGNVTIYSDSTVKLTVTGTNLQNGTEDNLVAFASGVSAHVTSSYFEFSTDGTTATLTVPNGSFVNSSNYEIIYSNNNADPYEIKWVNTGLFVTYDSGTKPVPYTITVNAAENGTVIADKQTAAEDETVTLTWTTEGTYELDNIVVEDADGNEVIISDKGLTAWTFIMPASNVTVTATFKEIATTSAGISWGSLAYTYTDEAGEWSAGTATGAGTVTVTNTGTTAITATPSYAATTDEYGTFTGSFDKDSIGIDAGANWTFKLTLDGTPTKAIPAGTKIGTVTITITEAVKVPDESENAAQEDSTPTP